MLKLKEGAGPPPHDCGKYGFKHQVGIRLNLNFIPIRVFGKTLTHLKTKERSRSLKVDFNGQLTILFIKTPEYLKSKICPCLSL